MENRIREIFMRHFRNYISLHVTLYEGLHVFLGPNGSGKTNFLEGVHFACTGQATRASRLSDLILLRQPKAYIKTRFTLKQTEVDVEWAIDRKLGRAAKWNGKVIRRQEEMESLPPVIYFSPDQLELAKGSPHERRTHFDRILRQLYPAYASDFQRYQKALQQRNEVLRLTRKKQAGESDLELWSEPVIETGIRLIRRRRQFVEEIEPILAGMHANLSGSDEVQVVYHQPYGTIAGDEEGAFRWRSESKRLAEEERNRGYTLIGPHRDDFRFYVHGEDARPFASQGQQRTVVLALLLAEMRYTRTIKQVEPLLLLDDVFSELDEERRSLLIEQISPGQQVLVTATDWSSIHRREPPQRVHVYRVGKGTIAQA